MVATKQYWFAVLSVLLAAFFFFNQKLLDWVKKTQNSTNLIKKAFIEEYYKQKVNGKPFYRLIKENLAKNNISLPDEYYSYFQELEKDNQ